MIAAVAALSRRAGLGPSYGRAAHLLLDQVLMGPSSRDNVDGAAMLGVVAANPRSRP